MIPANYTGVTALCKALKLGDRGQGLGCSSNPNTLAPEPYTLASVVKHEHL